MKIARYKRMGDIEHEIFGDVEGWLERSTNYIRTTEPVEVEFVDLPAEDLLEPQLKSLDAAESELRAKFQTALNDIEDRRAKLLAITHQEDS